MTKTKELIKLIFELSDTLQNFEATNWGERAHKYAVVSTIDSFRNTLSSGRYESSNEINKKILSLINSEYVTNEKRNKAEEILKKIMLIISKLSIEERLLTQNLFIDATRDKFKVKGKLQGKRELEKWWNFDLLVICALYDPELESFLQCMKNVKQDNHIKRAKVNLIKTYFTGFLEYQGKKVKVAAIYQERTGLTDAAALAVLGVHLFRPRVVAMTGVCAGRPSFGINKCDIIVPSTILTHDTGKHTNEGFKPEPMVCKVNEYIIDLIRTKGRNIINEITNLKSRYSTIPVVPPNLYTDIMACGSAVIDKEGYIEKVAEINRKVVALDMESYSIIRAIEMIDNRIYAFVVKSVMDHSSSKDDTMKKEASFWAANFLANFITSSYSALFENQ